jgi:probable HAF family extracellular repeat protein
MVSALAWLGTVSITSAQPTYRLIDVAPATAATSYGTQIDPTGTYVTGIAYDPVGPGFPVPPPDPRVFLWSGGTSTYLAAGAGAGRTAPSQAFVNASGQVVGTAVLAGTFVLGAHRWTASQQLPLQSLPGDAGGVFNTNAFAINAAGHAVGGSNISDLAFRAVQWLAGSTAVTLVSDGTRSVARSINDAGEVVGSALVFPCPPRPTFQCGRAMHWSGGIATLLEPPAEYLESAAYDINNAGQVLGRAYSGNTRFAAVVWTNGIPRALPPLNGASVMLANGINAAGQVVGQYQGRNNRAFLWHSDAMHDLTGLLDSAVDGWVIQNATSISDDGKIAVEACRTVGSQYACVAAIMVPTPPAAPVPAHTRYLAEGATSGFFNTQIALLNPTSTVASVSLRYLPASGGPITQAITVPARTRRTLDPKMVPGLGQAEFSTVVQSSQELVVDRTMSWDGAGYGSHSETAVRSPATTWYLAEGATIGGFDLFYLLQNPSASPTTVRVRYLRGAGAPLTKDYVLPASSRTNIWVNVEEFPGLGQALSAAEFSAVIEAQDGTPIIVERAMYRSNQGRTFNAGHESTGVSLPATDWFLAEGATGPFFDMFVLIANPTDTDAQVTVTYLTVDGTTYQRAFAAPANSRSGIWVDQEEFPGVVGKPLADAAVSTTVRSTNGVPLVVERAMWWPGDSGTWHEAHNSAGATATGTRWAVAEGEVGGARGHETYLLIANTSAFAGSATVTLLFEDGSSAVRTYPLPASSRTNVAVGSAFGTLVTDRRFGAVIESTGTTPAQIVVERAMYSSAGGVGFAAGTNALATKLQ